MIRYYWFERMSRIRVNNKARIICETHPLYYVELKERSSVFDLGPFVVVQIRAGDEIISFAFFQPRQRRRTTSDNERKTKEVSRGCCSSLQRRTPTGPNTKQSNCGRVLEPDVCYWDQCWTRAGQDQIMTIIVWLYFSYSTTETRSPADCD